MSNFSDFTKNYKLCKNSCDKNTFEKREDDISNKRYDWYYNNVSQQILNI
jgi:hypothetical protein